jgi:hypothetical protein
VVDNLYGIYVWHPIYNSTTSATLDPGGSYTATFGQRYCG